MQTQPNEALRGQLAGAGARAARRPLSVSPEQIRLLAYTAVAAGSRGLVFASDSPLDAADPDTRQRAMALELLNLELGLIEPWAAAGSLVATAESSVPEVAGTVLGTDHCAVAAAACGRRRRTVRAAAIGRQLPDAGGARRARGQRRLRTDAQRRAAAAAPTRGGRGARHACPSSA